MEKHSFNANTFLYHNAIQGVHVRTYFYNIITIDLLRPRSPLTLSTLATAMPAAHNSMQLHPVPFPSCQSSCRLAVTLTFNMHDKMKNEKCLIASEVVRSSVFFGQHSMLRSRHVVRTTTPCINAKFKATAMGG